MKCIKDWWIGKPIVLEYPFIGIIFEKHWTSRLAHFFIDPILKDPKWFIGSIVIPILTCILGFVMGRYWQ